MRKNTNKILKKAFTMIELSVTMMIIAMLSFTMYQARNNMLIKEEALNYSRNIVNTTFIF